MRWQRIVGWSLAAVGVLVIVSVAGGLLFLRTASFQRLAIRAIVSDTDEATGGHAEIGGFDFQLSTLTAHLYNVTLRGTEPDSQPPLLHVDKLTVGLKIQSILQRKFTLTELAIEHPVANVEVDREGRNNLPQAPPKQTTSNTSLFDLAAQHVILSNGQVQYNDRTIPVAAELYDLRTNIHFEPSGTRYVGSVSYDKGDLRYDDNPTFSHSLAASFSASPNQFSLQSAELMVGSSALSVSATLSNYSNPVVDGRYDLSLHTQDFSSMAKPVAAAGDLALSGKLHYQQADGQPVLRNVAIEGRISSNEILVDAAQGRLNLRALQGHYNLENGTFHANNVAFETFGGTLSSDISVEHLDTTPIGRIRTTLRRISLQTAQASIRQANVKNISFSGRLDGTVDASWSGSFNHVLGRIDLLLRSSAQQAQRKSSTVLPVTGAIHASYDGPKNVVTFRDTSLQIPSATLVVRGELSNHSNLQLQANSNDLHHLAEILSALGSKQASSLAIAGSASVKGQVQGTMHSPQVSGQFSANHLQVQGSEWRTLQAGFRAGPSQVSVNNAMLVSADKGKASLTAHAVLINWSYLPSNPVTATFSVQKMRIADLQRLANVHYPISGDLSADISVQGSELNPAGIGSARIDDAQVYGEPVQRLAATFQADRSSLMSVLNVNLPAGAASGTLAYTPKTKAYTVHLNAPSVILQKLKTVQARNLGIDGTLTLSANGQGTLDNPQLEASLEIPQLQVRGKSASEMKAELHVSDKRANLTLDSQVGEAKIHSKASVALSSDYDAEASIDTNDVKLEPLLAMYLPNPPQGFQGETELHATIKGPLKDTSRIEAHLTIPTLKASYQSLEVGAASPIRADLVNSVITLQPAEIRGTDTSLRVQGTFPLNGSSSPRLTAQGSVDVRIVKIFDPDVQSSGTVALEVHASGTSTNPAVQGQLRFQDVAISTQDSPLSVQKLNGNLKIIDNSLQLSGLTGEVGGGEVSAGGSISYRPDLQFNITLQSKSVRLRYPEGVRALLDGNLILSGTKDSSILNGRVLIDSLSFTPDFDLSKFSDQFGGTTVPSAPGPLDNIKLAVGLQSKSNLSATSSQISVEGDVNLQVVGTAANPVIVGRTDLTSGELFYRNVRYQLQRGIITFDNPIQTEPTLNVAVTTTVEQYNMTIGLRGPFDRLTTSYTSDPSLSTADVISLIANGQTASEASAAGTSTDSILASQAASQVTGGIQHLAGISSLQIDPLLGGNQNPSARVAVQQRVTKNFLFTFSTDLSQPGTEIVEGDYRINNRWSVSVTRDEVGGVSVDGKFHTKF